MAVSGKRGDAAARRALQVALLDQERLDHVLDGVAFLADGVRQVLHADRPAAEFLDHGKQELAIHHVHAERIHVKHLERRVGDAFRDRAVGLDLRVVAHAPQQAVGDARRAARAARDLGAALGRQVHFQQPRRAVHDGGELGLAVELEPRDDAKAIAQRIGEHTGARGGADQRERRQIELDGARRRPFADHDVDLIVLECRVQDLLDHRREPVDLVDEQDVARLEVGEQRSQVARALQHRPGGLAQVDLHLPGDDVRQRRLAQARRPEQQHVVQCLAPAARGLDEDLQLVADLGLPDVVGEPYGPERAFDLLFLRRGRGRGDQAVNLDGHDPILPDPRAFSLAHLAAQ